MWRNYYTPNKYAHCWILMCIFCNRHEAISIDIRIGIHYAYWVVTYHVLTIRDRVTERIYPKLVTNLEIDQNISEQNVSESRD